MNQELCNYKILYPADKIGSALQIGPVFFRVYSGAGQWRQNYVMQPLILNDSHWHAGKILQCIVSSIHLTCHYNWK